MVQSKTTDRKTGHTRPADRKSSKQISETEVSAAKVNGQELALVAGWFSYKNNQATFGDTEAMHVVTGWLDEANISYDIACHPVNGTDGLDINALDPTIYTLFIFVCGPWGRGSNKILERFSHCRKIGVDLTLGKHAYLHHGFDVVLARDMPGTLNPDLVFAAKVPTLPLVGIAQVHAQKMYGNRQRHQRVEAAINEYLSRGEVTSIILDTLHYENPVKIENAVQYENLVSRLDAVISTRLHGMVFALKRGVPVVAIDAIAGGAKVTAQANAVGWPLVLNGDTVDADQISASVKQCLNGSMKDTVARADSYARERLQQVKTEFLGALQD